MADETPEERLERFRRKAEALGPQEWSAPPEGSQTPAPAPEPTEGEKMEQLKEALFAPKWATEGGKKIGEALARVPGLRDGASRAIHAYAKFMSPEAMEERTAPLPDSIKTGSQRLVDGYRNLGTREPTVDEKLAEMDRKIAEAQAAQAAPRDIGDIDEPLPQPKTRSPYMQTREFSNEADKEAYLERVRQAMKNVAKPSKK